MYALYAYLRGNYICYFQGACVLTVTCHIRSGVKVSICGILLSLKNIDIRTFQSPKFQGGDASLPEWIGDFICY